MSVHFSKIMIAVGLGALLTACTGTGSVAYQTANCQFSPSKDVSRSFAEAGNLLADQACWNQEQGIFDQLLTVAKGDPDPDNKRLFTEHLSHLEQMGAISHSEARARYQRYFMPRFVSAASNYSIRSSCDKNEATLRKMRAELKDKKEGMLDVQGDASGFKAAQAGYDQLESIMEATCHAVLASR